MPSIHFAEPHRRPLFINSEASGGACCRVSACLRTGRWRAGVGARSARRLVPLTFPVVNCAVLSESSPARNAISTFRALLPSRRARVAGQAAPARAGDLNLRQTLHAANGVRAWRACPSSVRPGAVMSAYSSATQPRGRGSVRLSFSTSGDHARRESWPSRRSPSHAMMSEACTWLMVRGQRSQSGDHGDRQRSKSPPFAGERRLVHVGPADHVAARAAAIEISIRRGSRLRAFHCGRTCRHLDRESPPLTAHSWTVVRKASCSPGGLSTSCAHADPRRRSSSSAREGAVAELSTTTKWPAADSQRAMTRRPKPKECRFPERFRPVDIGRGI